MVSINELVVSINTFSLTERLQIVEDVLRGIREEKEALLKQEDDLSSGRPGILELAGTMTEEEAREMKDAVAASRMGGQQETRGKEDSVWQAAIQPMRKTITLEEMKEEQQYAPIDEKTFFELAEQINIEESIEELLAMLD